MVWGSGFREDIDVDVEDAGVELEKLQDRQHNVVHLKGR